MLPPGNVTRRTFRRAGVSERRIGDTRFPSGTLAVLGALCFFLSALEYMIPKPLPFIRIGLANLPLLLALDIMPFSSFVTLIGLKVIGQALISGTLFSYVFLFSLGGTGVSALLMYAIRRGLGKKMISLIGVSAAGALASNGIQLALARYFVFGDSVRYAAVPVLALGIVTGTLLGICCEYFIRRSKWYRQLEDPAAVDLFPHIQSQCSENFTTNLTNTKNSFSADSRRKSGFPLFVSGTREAFCRRIFSPGELAAAGLCMIPALLLNPNTHTRIIQFLFFFFLAWLSGKKINPLITIFVMLGIVFFNLLVPYGEILCSIGPLTITHGALMGGIKRAVTLEGLFMLSRCCVSRDIVLPPVFKPGFFGEIAAESFRIFSGLAEEKQVFNRRNWIERLDELLIRGTAEKTKPERIELSTAQPGSRTAAAGSRLILAAAVILAWLPVVKV